MNSISHTVPTMAEAVMAPVFTILVGAILIAAGLISAAFIVPWIRIVLGVGGVATILLGMVMLFGLAYGKPQKP